MPAGLWTAFFMSQQCPFILLLLSFLYFPYLHYDSPTCLLNMINTVARSFADHKIQKPFLVFMVS